MNSIAWEQCELLELLSLLKDGTHGTHKDVEDGPYLLSAKNIKNGQLIINKNTDRKISTSEYNKIFSRFALQKDDILLTIVGSIGDATILNNVTGIAFQRSVAFLRPQIGISPKFLYAVITTEKFQLELTARKSQSAQPGIYLGDLKKILVAFPKFNEQEKIGQLFEYVGTLITLHQ